MSKSAPWVKFFASDFLNGIADLDADEIGAYTVVLALIWDRGAPVPDDAAWIARRAGTSTRRFNQIRGKLLQLGKLEARNGLLGNRRAIEEVQKRDRKSDQARQAAFSRWHGHQEPELPLSDDANSGASSADYLGKKPRKKREKAQEQIDLKTRKSEQEPQKSAIADDADASSPSRARAFQRPEARVIHTEQENEVGRDADQPPAGPPAINPLDERDLVELMHACTSAAGFNPASPFILARELDIVKGWRDAGIDFQQIILPTIRSIVARTSDPTSSLKRFDRFVRLEFSKAGAQPKAGSAAYKPPASPILLLPDEDERMRPIKQDLLDRLGPDAFCILINPIRLEIVEDAGGGRNPVRVIDERPTALRAMTKPVASTIRQIVQHHGFSDVW